jgi:23S rRNA pseudouridine2605 synthase
MHPARHSGDGGALEGALVRLNKFLADHGVASRRASDELIQAGRVEVDGRVVTELGTKIDPARQHVAVDGRELGSGALRKRYYLLHKPAGVLCTNDPREARPRAIDLIDDRDKGRIYTVGRLDEESTGLILLTNDGEFANRVMHPSHGVPKTYEVRLRGEIPDQELNRIRDGVWLAEGRTAGARVVVKRRTAAHSDLAVTLREGRNREVRRVFARFGYKVTRLHRSRIGDLDGRGLRPGAWRPLTQREVEGLLAAADARRPLGPRGPRGPLGIRERRGARGRGAEGELG